jgi:HTH-type transcriptional regulator, competence development regulator
MSGDEHIPELARLGARIRAVRDARGLNLHELARLSGISAPALSLIENGKRDLRISSLHRIADALRISPGALLGGPTAEREQETPGAGYDLGDYA